MHGSKQTRLDSGWRSAGAWSVITWSTFSDLLAFAETEWGLLSPCKLSTISLAARRHATSLSSRSPTASRLPYVSSREGLRRSFKSCASYRQWGDLENDAGPARYTVEVEGRARSSDAKWNWETFANPGHQRRKHLLRQCLRERSRAWRRRSAFLDQDRGGHREGQVHLTVSRAGLTRSFNHYLTRGSEFDGHVARHLLGVEGQNLLGSHGGAVLFKLQVPGKTALAACNPYVRPDTEIPNLVSDILRVWSAPRPS